MDSTENTASNNSSVVVMSGCLAIDWILFVREHVYQLLLRNGCLFGGEGFEGLFAVVVRGIRPKFPLPTITKVSCK
jgi:hypothetical protein